MHERLPPAGDGDIVSAVPAALIALWLNRHTARRDAQERVREYNELPEGGWQAWQKGFYDIRDWARSIETYLRFGHPDHAEFSMIRIPGYRYLNHIIETGRVPADALQQVLILSEYCEILARALGHVLASDLAEPSPGRGPSPDEIFKAITANEPLPKPALVRLAEAVADMAQDLADPEMAKVRHAAVLAQLGSGNPTE